MRKYDALLPEWEKECKAGTPILQISNKYGVSRKTVTNYLRGAGIEITTSAGGQRKYSLDEQFFCNIDTEEKAYWLGFLCADGNVARCKHRDVHQVSISSAAKDKEHLEKFKDALKYDRKILQTSTYCRVSVDSVIIHDCLIKKGITPNKSLTLEMPKDVPEELYNHFVRGYFDGNGCAHYYDKRGYKDSQGRTKGGIKVMFTIVGAKPILTSISKIMADEIEIPFKEPKPKSSVAWFYHSGTVRIRKIREWLYRDATVYLERKKNIMDMI